MKVLIPDRFSIIRTLSEHDHSKTFVATDHALERSEMLVKIVQKGHFNCDRDHVIDQLSWFAGIRHTNLSVVFDAGITPKGDLYYVREYFPVSELFSADSLTAIKTTVAAVD